MSEAENAPYDPFANLHSRCDAGFYHGLLADNLDQLNKIAARII